MGDASDDDDDFDMTMAWAAQVERAEMLGFPDEAAALRKSGPYEPPRTGQPVIIDTDIGGDPDDAIAVAIAALRLPELALVVTSDERQDQRARFARHLLDLSGRHDVSVICGRALSETRYFCVDGLVPDSVPAQPTDVVRAVAEVCAHSKTPVRWVGMGPMSNLAAVLTTRPELAGKLTVTQMGGAINYRDPSRVGRHEVSRNDQLPRAAPQFPRRIRMRRGSSMVESAAQQFHRSRRFILRTCPDREPVDRLTVEMGWPLAREKAADAESGQDYEVVWAAGPGLSLQYVEDDEADECLSWLRAEMPLGSGFSKSTWLRSSRLVARRPRCSVRRRELWPIT